MELYVIKIFANNNQKIENRIIKEIHNKCQYKEKGVEYSQNQIKFKNL